MTRAWPTSASRTPSKRLRQVSVRMACGVDPVEVPAGLVHQAAHALQVQGTGAAVGQGHVERVRSSCGRGLGGGLLGALPGALVAVEDIVARHLVLAGAHQGQLHLVLDVLDVDGAAAGQPAGEGRDHLLGQLTHPVMDAGGGRGAAPLHRQEGLGHGDHDLVGVEVGDLAVAADDLDLARGVGVDLRRAIDGARSDRAVGPDGDGLVWGSGGRRFAGHGSSRGGFVMGVGGLAHRGCGQCRDTIYTASLGCQPQHIV